MLYKDCFANLDCTIIIPTIKRRRPWLNSALELYNDLYKGLKIAIVEESNNPNTKLNEFKNLEIIYKWGPNFSSEEALYELPRLANTKYVILQGDDDLILAERLWILIKIAKISKCQIVSFESILINESDRDLFCRQKIKNNFKKSIYITNLVVKRGLYQSTPKSSFYLNTKSRLVRFKKNYMMTEFSLFDREVLKKFIHWSGYHQKALLG